jgi:carbamoyltransferase
MRIIGIHFGHDSSVAYIKDGDVVASVEEERFTRIKTFKGFPYGGLKYIEETFGATPGNVDAVVVAGKTLFEQYHPETFRERLLARKGGKASKLRKLLKPESNYADENEAYFYEHMQKLGVEKKNIHFVEHHLAHAASAYYQSPFKNALVVTSDGKGDDVSAQVYLAREGKLDKLAEISSLASLGQMYSEVTRYLGFKPNRHEGKITGLASYGDAKVLAEDFFEFFTFDESSGIYDSSLEKEVNGEEFLKFCPLSKRAVIRSVSPRRIDQKYEAISCLYQKKFEKLCAGVSKEDIAAAVQYVLEEVTKKFVKYWVDKTGAEYVCLAGGVFANVKLNQRILELDGVKNVFIQPAMGDSGLSLGSALYHYARTNPDFSGKTIYDVYKGPEFSNDEISRKLQNTDFAYDYFEHDELARKTAQLLNEKRIVGLFNGRMEFGPRALGARSILIAPFDKSINKTVNERLNRTEFMPFAPVVLDKYADSYFKGYDESHIAAEFMTITYDVYEEKQKEIEAVVHVDGTARPQVIKREKNPLYYDILEAFYRLTGVPVLVNTSFNAHEEPILQNIDNAFNALDSDIVDFLVIGNFLVSKS